MEQGDCCEHITAVILLERTLFKSVIFKLRHRRIQPRTWYVKFASGLAVNRLEYASEQSTPVPPSGIKDVIDLSNRDGRRIRRLQHVPFAYKSADPARGLGPGNSKEGSRRCQRRRRGARGACRQPAGQELRA